MVLSMLASTLDMHARSAERENPVRAGVSTYIRATEMSRVRYIGSKARMWIVKLSRKPVEGAGPGSAPRLGVVWE